MTLVPVSPPIPIVPPIFSPEGTTGALLINEDWTYDALVDFKPEQINDMPANAGWVYKNERFVILEYSKDAFEYDPDLPLASGAIKWRKDKPSFIQKLLRRMKEKKQGHKLPEPEQEKWQKLPDNFRYVTCESVYFDLLISDSDTKTEYEMTDRDWISELHSGNIQNVPDKISPEEFGIDLAMADYSEMVNRSKKEALMKSIKSMHLYALGIMVIALIMLILLTSSGAGD
ncbi:uncharacterized protein METZ01_LOCUS60730 [marine metagenome]|uniref:Uncharacterized protein n=1 Tax=marine metagenome TaxID=408172 RepID=A0A381SV90_9ZZZZ